MRRQGLRRATQAGRVDLRATVDKQSFKMNFKYNVTETDVNDEPFRQFVDNVVEIINKQGAVTLKIESSASTVPTRAFSSNKELAEARASKGKEQIMTALKDKGVDVSKVKISAVKASVGGPAYGVDYLQNKEKYEQYQFIRITAY